MAENDDIFNQTDDGDGWGDDGWGSDGFSNGDQILNPNEIESLMNPENENDEKTGIQALLSSSTVSYERLPMLEVVFDRLVRMMSISLRNFMQDNVEITLEQIDSMRFSDYLKSIPQPALITIFKAEEWDNFGMLTVDSSLVYSIVDVLLGGNRGTAAMRLDGRSYTTIERNLIERMIHIVLSDLSSAFDPLSPVTFRFDHMETNPRFATICRPSNAAILAKLHIDMEGRGGTLELLLPYATLEPVRELLLQMFMGEKFGRDSIWENHLAEELWMTTVSVNAVLDRQMMSLKKVLEWEVGSRLMLNATPDSDVELCCGDVPMFYGRMGRKEEHIAIQVEDSVKYQKS